MENVYLVDGARTPFGAFGGGLAKLPAPSLAAAVIRRLVERSGIEPSMVEEVIVGQVLPAGAGQAPARQAMREAGLPDGASAMSINKVCGSGLKAIMLGADAITLGDSGIVVAGGMENMSLVPYALPAARFGARMGAGQMVDLLLHDALVDPGSGRHMGELTEERIAALGISREEQDRYARRSYERARSAVRSGTFAGEIVPVATRTRKGEMEIAEDEEPFRVDFDKFASLRPVFKKDGTITAANASTINDGAALVLLAGEKEVSSYGLDPMARIVSRATHSMHPDRFAEAPVGAIEKACRKAGLALSDIGLWEINEAFAAVPLMAVKSLGLDEERVNVNGGAVSLGHPVGASGGRLAVTLAGEMKRRGERYGLATLCIGGGEAVAVVFERT